MWGANETDRTHKSFDNAKRCCPRSGNTARSTMEPEMLHFGLALLPRCPQASQTLTSTPPPPPPPPTSPFSYCHLHLHSGPFQWWEAFISAARQDADMERAALLQRTMYLSERMRARGHIWDLHDQQAFFPDPTQDPRPGNSRGINRQQPSWAAMLLFEEE